MKRRHLLASTAALALACAPRAFAQSSDFPNRPIKLLVGFAPGGLTDLAARAVAEGMSKVLGQQVVVENRPGANSIIATQAVQNAPKDGYTLLFGGTNSMVLSPLLYRQLPYSVERDFAPIALLGNSPMILVVSSSLGVNSVQGFIELARAKPDTLTMAHAGNGNINHLGILLFESLTGVQLRGVPYKGSGPAIADLAAGIVNGSFDFLVSSSPQIKAGRLKALGVTSPRRVPSLPDVPTIAEAGVPGFDVRTFMMMSAPKGTPVEIVRKLSDAAERAVASRALIDSFSERGVDFEYGPPAEMFRSIAAETEKWGRLVRAHRLVLD